MPDNDLVPCPYCQETNCVQKNGFTKMGMQKYLCTDCNRKYVESTAKWLEAGRNNLSDPLDQAGQTRVAMPEMLVDMRYVFKTATGEPNESPERASLRLFKETNLREFLSQLKDLSKAYHSNLAAMRLARMKHKIAEASSRNEEIEDKSSIAVEARLEALLAECRGEPVIIR